MSFNNFLLVVLIAVSTTTQAQENYQHWDPSKEPSVILSGQAWRGETKNFYDRLPARAETKVRKDVWDLATNPAGVHIHFRAKTTRVIVSYTVTDKLQFPHMPATGVSGVDLYARNNDGKWLWCGGKYSFKDTITYKFTGLTRDEKDYYLYLPLYNTLGSMDISIPAGDTLTFLPPEREKPIVVYGTSIAQGGCATRAGLAWTSMLSRNLDWPVINLGFSGNGRLEPEVQDFVGEIDAKLFVLDCLPNLAIESVSTPELKSKIVTAVTQLRKARPDADILLTEHDGYTGAEVRSGDGDIERANTALKEMFDSLTSKKFPRLFYLSLKEIAQDNESMVDGIHPNDLGMLYYSNAYEKKIREIFHQPKGVGVTTIPVRQRRDFEIYDWQTRHTQVLDNNKKNAPKLVFIGNSITHYWAGEPEAPIARGKLSWSKYFEPKNAANLGFGWDRIENVLWRVYHQELDSIAPKQIVMMIGTNNLQYNTDAEIEQGLKFLITAIKFKQPKTSILYIGILPRREGEDRISKLNARLKTSLVRLGIKFADASSLFVKANKKINESLFTDGLHPNEQGYQKLGAFINAHLVSK